MDEEEGEDSEPPESNALGRIVDQIGLLLPAQGPISSFIHHNTLHAFEDMPFEEAVVRAGDQFGCESFLTEEAYRHEIASGRIRPPDVQALLARELGDRARDVIAGTVTRIDLRSVIALHGIPEVREPELSWLTRETGVLERFRSDLPPEARNAVTEVLGACEGPENEAERLRALWEACGEAVRHVEPPPVAPLRMKRHRDLLRQAYRMDIDDRVHPVLIRFLSAYLDQGVSRWPVPRREAGLYACFIELYSVRAAAWLGEWAVRLPSLLVEERAFGWSSLASLGHSLDELGVPGDEYHAFLLETALALRGWGGMVRQIEERPDRLPGRYINARLSDWLAVRLLLERVALAHAARSEAGFSGPLKNLRAFLVEEAIRPGWGGQAGRAWALYHVAQLCGMDATMIELLTEGELREIESELASFSSSERRRVLHTAYERFLSHHLYDALVQAPPSTQPAEPLFQAVFCLDEREESFRRHLEEVEPGVETFGTAGFFGVPMYFRSATDAQPRPLCPVAIRPDHYVSEVPVHDGTGRVSGLNEISAESLSGFMGALRMRLARAATIVPQVGRVLFPWLSARIGRHRGTASNVQATRLRLDREERTPPVGRYTGFTVEEMATIVRGVLEDLGISRRLAGLVLVAGHASSSLNNPHESAHDCGACGGGRGGPNARAFAWMANDPRVRERLAELGLSIPCSTWFVAAERNTCNNGFDYFDTDRIPAVLGPVFDRVRRVVDMVRERESHERCRRFDDVPGWYPPFATLAHVEARARNLAQPRPEYGHASNAFCIVGRRSRTRGLFLDRRAFLVSYDPTQDENGRVLDRILAAVLPVVAGISLEYYFGRVDPAGYGCGTKLPHNVTSLLGVMDGAGSDLRTGLPWQMVEIHEPVRLTVVVESEPGLLQRIVSAREDLERLVRNRWIFLAALPPHENRLVELTPAGFEPYTPRYPVPTVRGHSADWYQGKRGHLRIARIDSAGSLDLVV